MATLHERALEIYNEFVNFPSRYSIVRNSQVNDAYTILVFEILFNPFHKISKFRFADDNHRELLNSSIVPPPDDYIDIFYEEDDLDEKNYHIVQVKNSNLTQIEIESCFKMMENSIEMFLKKPNDLKKSLKNIIGDSSFDRTYKSNCNYYVVHAGDKNYIRNQKSNYNIITFNELWLLKNGTELESVPSEKFTIDTASNFIVNNFLDKDNVSQINPDSLLPKSLLCNFNGYDLAILNNKYTNTMLGRNILYGQNLRESLSSSSKTYESMFETINKEPELFLFYNNGITILSKDVDAKTIEKQEKIILKEFSIINGAQTTSTLGAYLREAEITGDLEKIQKLKKVYILTKIYEINPELQNHEKISENIKIFTNTQTPLSSRDMVSIRKEQIRLQQRFKEDFNFPNIFIFIKKGEKLAEYPKFLKHQQITNERLAQLAYCSYFRQPFTAKDKKSKIFDHNPKDGYTLNEYYHSIFDMNDGILFKKTNIELDELLFIYKLHEDAKSFHKNSLKNQFQNLNQIAAENEIDKKTRETRINRVKRNMEISNVCLFYNIAAYFTLKQYFDSLIENNNNLIFDSRRYYDDKEYKTNMITDFLELIYLTTLEIVRENSNIENVNNWIRSEKNEKIFLEKLDDIIINKEYQYSVNFKKFIEKYKNVCA
ncbi:MAG: AIPR family protein [Bacteroidales bacterium]|nr:AIPR family protein [Bacteroidales bacterium]